MQNFRFYKTIQEYKDFVRNEIFTTTEFKSNLFYHGLIEFIIEHRAPVFFEQTFEEEFSHFTQYLGFVLMRKGYYINEYVKDMYYGHDFGHMCFDNPLRPRDLTFECFSEMLNHNEWIASNETEVYTYYRVPGMREKSLSYTILYDLLQKAGYHKAPGVKELLDIRTQIIRDGYSAPLANHEDADSVFKYLHKFKENNRVWCRLWYEGFPEIEAPYVEKRLCLPLLEYERVLCDYRAGSYFRDQQAAYEHNVLYNIRTMAKLLGMHHTDIPHSFEQCESTMKKMEGKVFMHDVAKTFHFQYIKSKK